MEKLVLLYYEIRQHQVTTINIFFSLLLFDILELEDDECSPIQWRRGNVPREYCNWIGALLHPDSGCSNRKFRSFFAVNRAVFHQLHSELVSYNPRRWATLTCITLQPGIPSEIKVLFCLNILSARKSMEELETSTGVEGESIRKYFHLFLEDMIALYGERFLNRCPSAAELSTVEEKYDELGFPGCVGCVDCTHIVWKNCPLREKGQYYNRKDGKMGTIVAEVWVDHYRYVWHWYCGVAGVNNDLTVVRSSPLFGAVRNGFYKLNMGRAYQVLPGGDHRNICYFLVDGIYYSWPIFVKPIGGATEEHELRFSRAQESVRKDVECAFGVLQGRFQILAHPIRLYYKEDIVKTTEVCVVIHNMCVRLRQMGAFDDEEDLEEEHDEMIRNVLGDEFDGLRRRRHELRCLSSRLRQERDAGIFMEVEAERDALLTDESLHVSLMEDLVDLHNM